MRNLILLMKKTWVSRLALLLITLEIVLESPFSNKLRRQKAKQNHKLYH